MTLISCFQKPQVNFTRIMKILPLGIVLFSLKVFSNDFQNLNAIHKYLVHWRPSLKAGLGVGIHLIHPGLALSLKPPYLFFQLGPCLPEGFSIKEGEEGNAQSTYIYKEYPSVCLLVGIGTPPSPLPQVSVSPPPPPNQRVGGTLACGWGIGGVPIPTTGEKA
jgi:hypothetical protein